MEQISLLLVLMFFGASFGSFAVAQVWRLRANQLATDKKLNKSERIERDQLARLNQKPLASDRSRCLHCDYVLKWYDLVPIFSWLRLGGRCRECRRPIGYLEIVAEITVGLFFVLSYLLWPQPLGDFFGITQFILWLMAGVGLTILFIYDLKWMLLPDRANFFVILLGLISSIIALIVASDQLETFFSIIGSLLIMSGIYLMIYIYSKGQWIGFGDIKLGIGLGLFLADWRLAFIALFLANLIGCMVVLPALLTNNLKRNSHISFGPLMILGFVIAELVGIYIIDWYLGLI